VDLDRLDELFRRIRGRITPLAKQVGFRDHVAIAGQLADERERRRRRRNAVLTGAIRRHRRAEDQIEDPLLCHNPLAHRAIAAHAERGAFSRSAGRCSISLMSVDAVARSPRSAKLLAVVGSHDDPGIVVAAGRLERIEEFPETTESV